MRKNCVRTDSRYLTDDMESAVPALVSAAVFENNYRHLLMAMQNDRRVRDFAPEAVLIGE